VPWLVNPAVWFVLNQLRMTYGTFFLLEFDQHPEDFIYLCSMLSVLIFFIIGTGMAKAMSSCSSKLIKQWHASPIIVESGQIFNALLITLIVLSVTISVLYFYVVGYNLFLLGAYSVLSGHGPIKDVATMRLYSYSSDTYFGPGYVNQFKNTLLPLLVSFVAVRSVLLNRRSSLIMPVLLTPVVIIFLLGTGQRGAFVLAIICVAVFLLSTFRRLPRRFVLMSLVVVLTLFMLSSMILGRGTMELKDTDDLLKLLFEIPNRVLEGNQLAGIVGFRHMYHTPTAWGTEWLRELMQMIPGLKDHNYISTASQVYEVLYGSSRGTAPLSLVGSFWLNFNIIGVTILPFLLGILYQNVYHRFVMCQKTLFRLLIFSALAIVLGFWSGTGIGNLLNMGLVTIFMFYIIGMYALKMNKSTRTQEKVNDSIRTRKKSALSTYTCRN